MADITAYDTIVKGVNSPNNYTRSEAHLIDGSEFSGIMASGYHSLFMLPKGAAITDIKIISLETAVSSGSPTLSIAVKFGDVDNVPLFTAIEKSVLAKGGVYHANVDKKYAYDPEVIPLIRLAIGTAAFTTLKFLLIIDYIPVNEFMTAG